MTKPNGRTMTPHICLIAAITAAVARGGPLALPMHGALAAEATQTARPQIGKPVGGAQRLIKQKRYAEAMAKLRQADAVPKKTPYEAYLIAETVAAADIAVRDYPDAVKALEAVLASGTLPPLERLKRIQTIVELRSQIKSWPAFIDLR